MLLRLPIIQQMKYGFQHSTDSNEKQLLLVLYIWLKKHNLFDEPAPFIGSTVFRAAQSGQTDAVYYRNTLEI